MRFTKMQGIGNDYIYLVCLNQLPQNPSALAKRLSDRHYGIGSDGLVLICPSEHADFCMQMYNADGTQAEMCGNAIRCVGKLVYDRGLTQKTTLQIETLAGIKTLWLTVSNQVVSMVTVDMGLPILQPHEIPVLVDGEQAVRIPIPIEEREYTATCVSMGNPHAVLFLDAETDLAQLNLGELGPLFEHHPLFPKRINTEFAQVIDRTTIAMRVWERGAGETLACGTGACATLVAAVLCGLTDRECSLQLKGGTLRIRWDQADGHVYMTGPAAVTFTGEFDDDLL